MEKNLKSLVEELKLELSFKDRKEILVAKETALRYFKEYDLDTSVDKMLLKQLINLEIIQHRLQEEINVAQEKGFSVTSKELKTLHDNLDNILKITSKLGVTKDKQDSLKTDGFKALELLQQKASVWRSKNQLTRNCTCPECGKMFLLKRDMRYWKALKHPYIQDRILVNDEMLSWLGRGIISVGQFAKALGTSPDYITWMIGKLTAEKIENYNLFQFINHEEVEEEIGKTDDPDFSIPNDF